MWRLSSLVFTAFCTVCAMVSGLAPMLSESALTAAVSAVTCVMSWLVLLSMPATRSPSLAPPWTGCSMMRLPSGDAWVLLSHVESRNSSVLAAFAAVSVPCMRSRIFTPF